MSVTACNPSFTKQVQEKDGRFVITGHVNLLVALVVVDKWLILKLRTSFFSGL
jgi:hypothetical protein